MVAVGEARTVLPTPDLSTIKLVDTQTKAIGVIQPPPDIRAIVDKTANFVAKNGIVFEQRILANEANNAKFNFLRPADPYHAYYRYKVTEGQEAGTAAPASAAQQAEQAAQLQQAAAQPAAAAKADVVAPTKPLEKPEEAQYMVHVPEGLTLQDLDIIKLTAQFVARNGKQFLTGLASREHANPQFNFLKPTHSLFGFFTALCDAYSKVLMPPKGTMERLQRDTSDRTIILERCLRRLEWERVKEREQKAAADQAEAERLAMQSIDWHDFVVVETIDFFEDEDAELPPPMTQRDVILLNKAQPFQQEEEEAAAAAAAAEKAEADGKVEMDEEEKAMIAEAGAPSRPPPAQPPSQPPPDGGAAAAAAGTGAAEDHDADMDMDMDMDPGQMKIVRNYQRADPRAAAQESAKHVVSPITGELVPIEHMAEHMRISLIDPKWKSQRDAMMAKIRETTKASDQEIGANLLRLAGKRPDVFGSTQEEVSSLVQASIADSKISGGDRPVVWDGETRRGEGLHTQLRAISENKTDLAGKRKEPEVLPPPPMVRPGPMPGSLPPPPAVRLPPGAPGPAPPRPNLPPPPIMRPQMQPPMQRPPPQMPPPMQPPMQRPPMQMGLPPLPGMPMHMQRPQMPPPMGQRPPMMVQPPPMQRPLPPPPQMGMQRPPMSQQGAPMPAPPMAPPPPVPSSEPEPKRQRTEFVLQPEEEFLDQHPGPSKVRVLCPEVEGYESLQGQLLEVEVASLTNSVGDLKNRLADVLNIPANKQKIGRDNVGFMRDDLSLAHYNVSPETQLTFGVKERGGRKK
ncbi:hypothetical protein WJX72_012308 [[Myrmecia] bisecta]|uniref:Splicing factor 3A subunit 1 n=1 Tax=[Myrmecia] bisecta TaxID=41462 RepID=A0AAW1PF05_9CHLO